jgi:hypothetical protein
MKWREVNKMSNKVKAVIIILVALVVAWLLIKFPIKKIEAEGVQKTWICHVPPGNPNKAESKYLPIPKAKGHLKNHKLDYRGKCKWHKECVDEKCVRVHGDEPNQCRCDKDCEKPPACEWSEWSECSVECGWGTQTRIKKGVRCEKPIRETRRCFVECEEPTPTPEPPCKENCDAPPVSPNTHRTEQTCNGVMPSKPACTVGYFVDGDTAYLGWWKYQDSASKLMLRYGYSPDNLEYGIDSIPTDSEGIEVNGVATDGHIYYQLGVDRDKCVVWSSVCDP